MIARKIAALTAIYVALVNMSALAQTAKPKPVQSQDAKLQTTASNMSLNRLLASPSEWRSVDWSKPGVLDDLRWLTLKEQEVRADGAVLTHKLTAPAFNLPTVEHLRWRTTHDLDIMFVLYADVPSASCANIAASIGNDLGQPIHSDDTSRLYLSESSHMNFVAREWQWTVGNTRIGSSCFGVLSTAEDNKNQSLTLTVTFEPVSHREALKPAFLLLCTRTLRLSSGGDPRLLNDFVFWVKQGPPATVRDTRFVVLGDTDTTIVNEVEIAFTLKNSETTSTRYEVDRVSGQIRGSATAQGKPVGTVSGTCSKVDAKTKF